MTRLLPLFAALISATAAAQAVSPGPLSEGHADLDNPTKCTSCHQLSGKTAFAQCTSCHTHQPLKKAVEANEGLHAKVAAGKPCEGCHTEHKGKEGTVADWSKVGGQTQFDHKVTGFVLKGMHEKVKCTACHRRPTRSGWILFAGLSDDCDACHKNPHKFTDTELRSRCLDCHVTGGVAPKLMKPADVPFDHAKVTGIALVHKHAQVRCSQCHAGGKMSMERTRTCRDCHKNPHTGGQAIFVKNACPTCHAPSRGFKEPQFDHSTTEWPLWGLHAKTACRACHAKPKPAPKPDCATCHRATHRDRFKAFACSVCHAQKEDKFLFNHGEQTRFTLTDRHAEIKCRACHRGTKPWQWEKFNVPAGTAPCRSCHRHSNAHKGQFDDKQCLACHLEGGSKKLTFDHDKDAKFALEGAHQALADAKKCKSCHKDGLYRNGKTACVDCHKDAHDGTLGASCQRCHSPTVRFKKTKFDHSTVKAFQLEGLHLEVDCEKCHPARRFKTGKTRCADCHGATEPHGGKLGDDCARCHQPQKGAPRFNHDTMTRFPRVGRHAEVACALCHQPPPASPPAVGWTRGLAPAKLDLRFPVMGTRCAQCHADNHAGANGPECGSCHKVTAFRDVSVSVHDTGAFRLGGKHASLPCARCHTGGRLLAGSGEACQLCHRDDDRHGNALGPYCGECHVQNDWAPSSFVHAQTSFPLLGSHRTVDCRRCHGPGTFQGLPTACEGCHRSQAAQVIDPLHRGADFEQCEGCHSPGGFRPARFTHPAWPLIGNHRRVSCASCHQHGVYAGTPDTCETCHLARYLDPSTQPNHRALGYPTSCGDCHTPAGWRPARAP